MPNSKNMISFSTFRNLIIGVLLFMFGMVIGQRYRGRISLVSSQLSDDSSSAFGKLVGTFSPPENREVNFDIFWEVWQILENEHLEANEFKTQEMVDGAIQGLTRATGDPYTVYLPPQDNKRSGEDLQGSFFGVGIELGYIDGVLGVVAPLEGTPADLAGIEAGDLILHVKDEQKGIDEDSSGWSLIEAVENIRGPRNSAIIFTLFREGGDDTFEVTVRRDEILVDTVNLEIIEFEGKNFAHLRVSRFGGRTKEEWDEVVGKILGQNPKISGIALDFRNNPGGYFDLFFSILF